MKFSHDNPLVLLPGTGCNELLWSYGVLSALPDSIMPVMPNLLACTSQQAMLQVINDLPYKKFILLGFSMGGYLAQHFYAKYPARVSHLILLCTSGEEKHMSAAMIERSLELVNDESYLLQMINPISPEQNHILYTQLRTMLDQVGPDALKRQMYATAHRQSVLDQFPEKPAPTLIVGARHDRLVPTAHIERLAASLKSNVIWVKSGHMLPLEAPEELGEIINNWLTYIISSRSTGAADIL